MSTRWDDHKIVSVAEVTFFLPAPSSLLKLCDNEREGGGSPGSPTETMHKTVVVFIPGNFFVSSIGK